MNRGFLSMAGVPSHAGSKIAGEPSSEGLSDAQIMLRVKAGDESAFEYLVQKVSPAHVELYVSHGAQHGGG